MCLSMILVMIARDGSLYKNQKPHSSINSGAQFHTNEYVPIEHNRLHIEA
jgi:hypothetical protein